jgi:hypothetical protein
VLTSSSSEGSVPASAEATVPPSPPTTRVSVVEHAATGSATSANEAMNRDGMRM